MLHKVGEQLSVEPVELHELRADEVCVEIKAAGICHSDLNYRDGVSPVARLPIILGHEISGLVVERGENVKEVSEGSRACVHYVLSCGECGFCRVNRENLCEEYRMIGKDLDGGFAEFINVPSTNVLELPENMPFEQGALVGCAVSTAYHALKRARVNVGDTVVVYGVGGVGIHGVQLAAKVFGAGRVIAVDVSDEKLRLAGNLGADEVVNVRRENVVERIRGLTIGKLGDVVLDFVGLRATIEEALECVGKGGRLAVVGIGSEDIRISPYRTVIGKEMEIVGVNDHLKSEMEFLLRKVQAGEIDLSNSVTHRVSLDNVNRGMEVLKKKIGNPSRVVVTP